MSWGEASTAKGVRERGFTIDVDGRVVPGVLWQPERPTGNDGLLMLGHGGTADKRAPYLLAIARWLVRDHGVSAFAIDAPGHGERIGNDVAVDFQNAWSSPATTDETVADWHGALNFVREEVGDGPLGYWGLSMGTMMGVPLVAATPDVRAALLGLMGIWGPNAERLRADAPSISCPVRFLVQWDDEIVPRDKALDLFTAIGSQAKNLRGNPGRHVDVPPAEMRASTVFLADHLKA